MARVEEVIAETIFSGSILNVLGSISTKTGFRRLYNIALEVATNVKGVVITSAPSGRAKDVIANSKAAVPELTATAYLLPTYCAKANSNSFTFGPVVSQPDCRTVLTAATSLSSIEGRPLGINVIFIFSSLFLIFFDS